MTTTEAVSTATNGPSVRSVLTPLVVRFTLIIACTLVAFWSSLTRTTVDTLPGGMYEYILTVPLMVFVAGIGITRHRHDELPIHDREVDVIVGGIALALSVATAALLVPRYRDTFYLLRTDLLAMLLFLFGACVLVFGLRPAGRYWPIWLVVVTVSPLAYRAAVISLGGTWLAAAVVSTVLIAIAAGITVARTLTRGLIGALGTLALGFILLGVQLAVGYPAVAGALSSRLAPLTAGTSIVLAFWAYSVRIREPRLSFRPQRTSPVTRPWKAALLVLATAAALFSIPLPAELIIPIATGPPLPETPGLVVPEGWTQTGVEPADWPPRFFGAGATIVRQTWTADEVNPEWDDKGRRRTVVADSLLTRDPDTLNVYPGETLYSTIKGRRSPIVSVDLGHDVRGLMYTIVDQNLFLTWTKLNFQWTRGDGTVQVVNLISVDNHDPGAQFPQLDPAALSVATQTINVLFRGNAVLEDEEPDYKDSDMLTELGRDVVATQWEVAS